MQNLQVPPLSPREQHLLMPAVSMPQQEQQTTDTESSNSLDTENTNSIVSYEKQAEPESENAVNTSNKMMGLMQRFENRLNQVLISGEEKEKKAIQVFNHLHRSFEETQMRASLAESNVGYLLHSNNHLEYVVSGLGQELEISRHREVVSFERTVYLSGKIAQNDARLLCKEIDKKVSLLNTLKDKYLNHVSREEAPSTLTAEELEGLTTHITETQEAKQTMLQSVQETDLSQEQFIILRDTINLSMEKLNYLNDKIDALAALVAVDTKQDALSLNDNARVAYKNLRDRQNTLLDLSRERNEVLLITVPEKQLISELLANLEGSANKLALASNKEALSLEDIQELWKTQTETQKIMKRVNQKTENLQNIISVDAKHHAKRLLADIDAKLNLLREIEQRLQRPQELNAEILATPEELNGIQQVFQALEVYKNDLRSADYEGILSHNQTQDLHHTLKEINTDLPTLDGIINELNGRVSTDAKRAAEAIVAFAPNRLELANTLNNIYQETLTRTNQAAAPEAGPSLLDLSDLINGKLGRMQVLTAMNALNAEQIAKLTLLNSEVRAYLIALEEKNTRFTALSTFHLSNEKTNLTATAQLKKPELQTLLNENLAYVQPAIQQDERAQINALVAKLERNRQGLFGDVNHVATADQIINSNELNKEIKLNLEAATQKITHLQQIYADYVTGVKNTAGELCTTAENTAAKLENLLNTYSSFRYALISYARIDDIDSIPARKSSLDTIRSGMNGLRYRQISNAELGQLKDLITRMERKLHSVRGDEGDIPELRSTLQRIHDSALPEINAISNAMSHYRKDADYESREFYENNPASKHTYDAIYKTIKRTVRESNLAVINLLPVVGNIAYIGIECAIVADKEKRAKERHSLFKQALRAKNEIPTLLANTANY